MSMCMEIAGGAGPRETAAILAALGRLAEERTAAGSVPPQRPSPGRWVDSGRPRPIANPFVHQPVPAPEGWSVGSGDLAEE